MRRSPYQTFAAVLTMFLTLLLAGVFFLSSLASMYILQYFEGKPQITVFFNDKAVESDAKALQEKLETTGKVASVHYVSKNDALALYREQNKNDPLLLEMVTADILPASLEVSALEPKFLADLVPIVKSSPNVEEVVYQKDVVDTLISWTNAIRTIGGVLAGLFGLDAMLIMMLIIGMKISMKKKEVEILTLIGASPWYIRAPFILEGGLYGMIGAFIAWAATMAAILILRNSILMFIGVIPAIHAILINPFGTLFLLFAFFFFAVLTFIGFVLGSLGSIVAVSRYLKI